MFIFIMVNILNSKYRISLKKRGGSQLASGGAGDAKGLFMAGLEFYKKQDKYLYFKKH